MKIKVLISILLNVIIGSVYSQITDITPKIDSLKMELDKATNQLQKSKILYELGLEYFYKDNIIAKKYFAQIEEILPEIQESDSFIVDFYNSNAALYANIGEYKKSDSLYDLSASYSKENHYDVLYHSINTQTGKAVNEIYKGDFDQALLILFQEEKNTMHLDSNNIKHLKIHSLIHSNIAIALANQGNLSEALLYFQKHLNYFETKLFDPNNTISVGELLDAYNNVALCHDLLNQSSQSIVYYQKALMIADEYSLNDRKKNLCSNLSSLFLKQKNFQKSIYYASQALGENNDWNANAYNNIGVSKMKLGAFNESNINLFKALELYTKQKRKASIGFINNNIGINYMNLEKYDSSLYFLNKSLKIYEDIEATVEIPMVNEAIGSCYLKSNNLSKALPYLLKAEEAFEIQQTIREGQIYNRDHLYQFYKKSGDIQNSLLWLEKKYQLEKDYDSLRNYDKVNELEAKFESQQKENKILKLSNENIKKEAALLQSRYALIGTVLAFLLLSGLGYFFWLQQKQKQKFALLKSSISASELEKNRIGRELHDGIASRILKIVYETDKQHLKLSNELLEVYQQLRKISHQLEGTPVHSEALYDSLLDIIPESNAEAKFVVKIRPQNLEIEEPYRSHIYRLIQELMTNNLKHAKASFTILKIVLENEILSITYKDNGCGSHQFSKGYGHKSMEDRVQLLNGSMVVKTQENEGFETQIQFPYKMA